MVLMTIMSYNSIILNERWLKYVKQSNYFWWFIYVIMVSSWVYPLF